MKLTLRNVHGVSSKTGSLPDESTLLGKKTWNFTADKLVRDRFLAVRVQLVRVCDFPRSAGGSVVVRHCLERGGEFRLLSIESISIFVFCAADFTWSSSGVDLEDSIMWAVYVGVDTETEQVLVVVGIDAWVNFGAPAVGVLAGVHGVGIQDTGQLNIQLDSAVLVEDPVDAVFIVRSGKDVRENQFTATSDNHGLVAEIGMLVEDTSIFFMDADGVLHNCAGTGTVDKCCIHVVDCALAVAAERQAVGHVAATVLSQVKSMLSLVGVFRVAVWDNHLG